MSFKRRQFLKQLAAFGSIAATTPYFQSLSGQRLLKSFDESQNRSFSEVIQDETFWYQVKNAYTVSPNIVNLNNGGVSPQPLVVQEAVERYNRLSNEAPSFYMWRILDQGREPVREKLADLAGCSPEEIAINRNASEALETVIFGLRLKKGDEVVLTRQDYPNMINSWKQRAHRDGVVLKWLDFQFPIEDKSKIVEAFVNAFTPRTKVVHITHMINWMGQILPVKEIALAAKERGIEVLVDGAHTFAHLDFDIPSLQCDYFGTSLHKWLCAPFGTGMLYVRKEKIKNLYPMFGAEEFESEDIRKFEHLGTRSFALEQAIGQAVDFHHMIGSERKEARLRYLRKYWISRVKDLPGVTIHSPEADENSCGIGSFAIEGKGPKQLSALLYRDFKIHTSGIVWDNVNAVRVTPNVYTVTRDLDRLVRAIKSYV
ncbi:MAG: aminotransferase class V-fold PLP-dependent enzyme [Saprospiraceae bacterium]|nr:aminotransferase class V-fold PLP-dependent enzyme [Saprospiraceae bacterium]